MLLRTIGLELGRCLRLIDICKERKDTLQIMESFVSECKSKNFGFENCQDRAKFSQDM
jgi:hypothetical protein